MTSVHSVILKKGRERSLLRRHPWVFSGAIDHVEGAPQPGRTVEVVSHDGQFLARGAYSPASQIRVRCWTYDARETIDAAFFHRRIAHAIAKRESWQIAGKTTPTAWFPRRATGCPV